ncbi:MAG: Uma2 family endonuclease [Lewinellaceae bacterium]|nr:Uma2 family endonuclease [Lewinellaceae bacterium]
MTAPLSRKKTLTLEDLVLQFGAVELQNPLSRETFMTLADQYPDLTLERDKNGITTIMSPVKKGSGKRESTLNGFLFIWNHQHRLGEVHGPSSGFNLPDGSFKQPDAAWISNERLGATKGDDDEAFLTVAPDFVAEIRSATDRLKKLQTKMTDVWMANGVQLAWLIDPYDEKAYIYRLGREVELVEGFAGKTLSGGAVLPGFELPLDEMRRDV